MKTFNFKYLLLIILTLNSLTAFGKKPAKKTASETQATILKIKLETESLDVKINNTETAKEIQDFFGKEIKVPFATDEKTTIEGYKGIDEQTQRQMLCADINDTIDLLAAESEATSVSKIDSKLQRKLLMLKTLQEQIALTWADKNFFSKDGARVSAKEIRDTMRTELPLSLPTEAVKEYFCNPNSINKLSDCK